MFSLFLFVIPLPSKAWVCTLASNAADKVAQRIPRSSPSHPSSSGPATGASTAGVGVEMRGVTELASSPSFAHSLGSVLRILQNWGNGTVLLEPFAGEEERGNGSRKIDLQVPGLDFGLNKTGSSLDISVCGLSIRVPMDEVTLIHALAMIFSKM